MRNSQTFSVAMAIALLGSVSAFGQYDLSWNTIDGGGATFSTGGSYSLGGTIGQWDAATALTGGTYTLTGGFWAGVTGSPCTLIGDFDNNGAVALSDLTFFLSNFGTPSGATAETGDLTGDGAVSLADLTIFLSNFGTICP